MGRIKLKKHWMRQTTILLSNAKKLQLQITKWYISSWPWLDSLYLKCLWLCRVSFNIVLVRGSSLHGWPEIHVGIDRANLLPHLLVRSNSPDVFLGRSWLLFHPYSFAVRGLYFPKMDWSHGMDYHFIYLFDNTCRSHATNILPPTKHSSFDNSSVETSSSSF